LKWRLKSSDEIKKKESGAGKTIDHKRVMKPKATPQIERSDTKGKGPKFFDIKKL